MKLRRGSILTMLAVPAVAIGLAACGGSSNSSSGATASNAAQTTTGGSSTVSTKSVGGVGTVLVDSKGDVLYTNNQDTSSKVVCSGSCNAIWPALMAPSSGKPTSSDSSVQSKLGVLKGQVTYNGKPLYTFVSDTPGQATGNGAMDSFNGTSFTWSAATTGGSGAAAAPPAATTTSSNTSSGGSSGGYGY